MVSGEENRRKKRGRGRTDEMESEFLVVTCSRGHNSVIPHPRPSSRWKVATLPRERSPPRRWHRPGPTSSYIYILPFSGNYPMLSSSRKQACIAAKSLQLNWTLPPHSLPGSYVLGILQAKILEWVVMPFSRGSFRPRDQTMSLKSSALASGFFTTSTTW